MDSLNQLISLASKLNPVELRQLSVAIKRLSTQKCQAEFHLDGITYRLTRLSDGEFIDSMRRSLAIQDDYHFLIGLFLTNENDNLNFAEIQIVLSEKFGPSGKYFDTYKGSFSFPFALDVIRGDNSFAYLFEVHNCRDSLYYSVRKIVPENDPRLKEFTIRQPVETEFSRTEINRFTAYFHGYLRGYWESIREQPHESFVRIIPASSIVYGCVEGCTFEEYHKTVEELDTAAKHYLAKIGNDCDDGIVIDTKN
jgi:hypothetical protein